MRKFVLAAAVAGAALTLAACSEGTQETTEAAADSALADAEANVEAAGEAVEGAADATAEAADDAVATAEEAVAEEAPAAE